MIEKIKNWSLFFAALFISLFLGEFILKTIDPAGVSIFAGYLQRQKIILKASKNHSLQYVHKENSLLKFKNIVYGINSQGLREREILFNKPRKTFRIVGLGDSVVFGTGVQWQDTFLKQLGNLLKKTQAEACGYQNCAGCPRMPFSAKYRISGVPKPRIKSGTGKSRLSNRSEFSLFSDTLCANDKKNFETINCGVAGYNTLQEFELLKQTCIKYSPDLVLLIYSYNDCEPISNLHSAPVPSFIQVGMETLPYVFSFVFYIKYTYLTEQRPQLYYGDFDKNMLEKIKKNQDYNPFCRADADWRSNKNTLRNIVKYTKERNIRLIIFQLFDNPAISSFAKKEFLPIYNLNMVELKQLKYRNSRADPHPNALCHKIIAKKIFTFLQKLF